MRGTELRLSIWSREERGTGPDKYVTGSGVGTTSSEHSNTFSWLIRDGWRSPSFFISSPKTSFITSCTLVPSGACETSYSGNVGCFVALVSCSGAESEREDSLQARLITVRISKIRRLWSIFWTVSFLEIIGNNVRMPQNMFSHVDPDCDGEMYTLCPKIKENQS